MNETPDADAPAIVVGAGPVGLVAAAALSRHGVRTLLVDRELQGTTFPKMDITNSRSMELLRRIGLADYLRRGGASPDDPFDVLFATRLGEPLLSAWRYPSPNAARRMAREVNDGTQPLEPALRISLIEVEALLREAAHRDPLIDFRPGWRFDRCRQDEDGVEAVFTDLVNTKTHKMRCRYLLGCDGASSTVRKELGIALEGTTTDIDMFMVHFRSTDPKLRCYGKFWHLVFELGGAIVSQDGKDIWTCHGVAGPEFSPTDVDPAAFVADVVGTPIQLEVLETGGWRANELLAARYRDGRVLLAGDAVHQVHPAGGYGMNTGLGDAVAAAWIIGALINGWGGERLLDGYEIERRQQGANVLHWSQHHLKVWLTWWRRVSGGLQGRGPQLDPEAHRRMTHAFLQEHRGENESLGVEMGYRYRNSPIICHEDGAEPPWEQRKYLPTTWPGSRPPSVFLSDGRALFDEFGAELTLVDFSGAGAGRHLIDALTNTNVPVKWLRLTDAAARALWERDLVLVRPDQHVAWRGHETPGNAAAIVDRVRGATHSRSPI